MREKSGRDLNQIRCIKDNEGNILVKDDDIRERWRNYFNDLFNDDHSGNMIDLECTTERNINYTRRIKFSEVKEALKRIKVGKACGPDEIPIEV